MVVWRWGRMRRWGLAAALLVAAAAPAGAEVIELYGKSLEVAAPPGFCAFDVMRPAEAEIIRGIEQETGGRSVLLTAFASCQDLIEMRAGRGSALARMGQIFVGGRSTLPKDLAPGRRAYLERAATDFKPIARDDLGDAVAAFQDDSKGAAAAVVGSLGRDDNAIYSVLVAGTKDKPIVGIIGITLVHDLPTNLTIYGNYVGPETFDALLADVQAGVANLLTNNGALDEQDNGAGTAKPGGGLSFPTILLSAGGLILGVGLLVFLTNRLRRRAETPEQKT